MCKRAIVCMREKLSACVRVKSVCRGVLLTSACFMLIKPGAQKATLSPVRCRSVTVVESI